MLKSIKLKNSSFKYYSILTKVRQNSGVIYSLYIIPSDFYLLDPLYYTWGWDKLFMTYSTNTINNISMAIKVSMSNQLWIKIDNWDCFNEFKVVSFWLKPVDKIYLI
jgi:hypothetical protein